MECPFCGTVMYEGYVRASATRMYKGDIYWQDEKDSHKKLWLSENRIWKLIIMRICLTPASKPMPARGVRKSFWILTWKHLRSEAL